MLIWEVIKDVFKKFYDSLFFFIFFSLIMFLLISPIVFLVLNSIFMGVFLPYLLPLFLVGPIILSGLRLVDLRYNEGRGTLRQIFTGLPGVFINGLTGFIYSALIYLILYVALNFYLVRVEEGFLMMALTALVAYFILFFTMTQMFFWGISAIREEMGFIRRMKYSLLIPLDNIIQAFLWLMVQLAFIVALFIVTPGLPVLFFSLTGLLVIAGTRKLLAPYISDAEGTEGADNTVER